MPEMSPFEKRGRLVLKMMAVKTEFFVLFIIAIICIGLSMHR